MKTTILITLFLIVLIVGYFVHREVLNSEIEYCEAKSFFIAGNISQRAVETYAQHLEDKPFLLLDALLKFMGSVNAAEVVHKSSGKTLAELYGSIKLSKIYLQQGLVSESKYYLNGAKQICIENHFKCDDPFFDKFTKFYECQFIKKGKFNECKNIM